MQPNPYESPAVVQQKIEPLPLPRWSRWILWLIPVALVMGLFASCAGGCVISETAIEREVQKMRAAGKGWDADDLDLAIVGQAELRGLIAFALLATVSVAGIPIGALALWAYLPQLMRRTSHSSAVTRDSDRA